MNASSVNDIARAYWHCDLQITIFAKQERSNHPFP
jgi:hypothetical protein